MKIPTSPLLLTLPLLTGTLAAPLPSGQTGNQASSPNIDEGASPRIGGSGRFEERSWGWGRGAGGDGKSKRDGGEDGWKEGLEKHRLGKTRQRRQLPSLPSSINPSSLTSQAQGLASGPSSQLSGPTNSAQGLLSNPQAALNGLGAQGALNGIEAQGLGLFGAAQGLLQGGSGQVGQGLLGSVQGAQGLLDGSGVINGLGLGGSGNQQQGLFGQLTGTTSGLLVVGQVVGQSSSLPLVGQVANQASNIPIVGQVTNQASRLPIVGQVGNQAAGVMNGLPVVGSGSISNVPVVGGLVGNLQGATSNLPAVGQVGGLVGGVQSASNGLPLVGQGVSGGGLFGTASNDASTSSASGQASNIVNGQISNLPSSIISASSSSISIPSSPISPTITTTNSNLPISADMQRSPPTTLPATLSNNPQVNAGLRWINVGGRIYPVNVMGQVLHLPQESSIRGELGGVIAQATGVAGAAVQTAGVGGIAQGAGVGGIVQAAGAGGMLPSDSSLGGLGQVIGIEGNEVLNTPPGLDASGIVQPIYYYSNVDGGAGGGNENGTVMDDGSSMGGMNSTNPITSFTSSDNSTSTLLPHSSTNNSTSTTLVPDNTMNNNTSILPVDEWPTDDFPSTSEGQAYSYPEDSADWSTSIPISQDQQGQQQPMRRRDAMDLIAGNMSGAEKGIGSMAGYPGSFTEWEDSSEEGESGYATAGGSGGGGEGRFVSGTHAQQGWSKVRVSVTASASATARPTPTSENEGGGDEGEYLVGLASMTVSSPMVSMTGFSI